MYAMPEHVKDRTDYILGLAPWVASDHDQHHSAPPHQVRSAALFTTTGGYESHPVVAQILHQRIVEICENPSRETVFLVAHGDKSDDADAHWLAVINENIRRLRQDPHCRQLKSIHAVTVREDWPEKREKAVSELRMVVEKANRDGTALVIADRLYGAGPYRQFLDPLPHLMNERCLSHPLLSRWLEEAVHGLIPRMTAPLLVD